MINQVAPSVSEALGSIRDNETILVGGVGTAGVPEELVDGDLDQGARNLTLVCDNEGKATQASLLY